MQADIHWFPEIDSTNDYVRRMVEQKKLFPPTTIAARKQTAGRGRGENRWWSPDGCLMFTSLLDSGGYARHVAQLPQAALVVGIALAELLSQYIDSVDVQLKWPNDVYVRGRKIAGILVEGIQAAADELPAVRQLNTGTLSTSPRLNEIGPTETNPSQTAAHNESLQPNLLRAQGEFWWSIGVGLNLAIDWTEAPEDVRRRATCVARECGVTFRGEEFLPLVVEKIEYFLERWRGDATEIFAIFRNRCFLRDKWIEVQQGRVQYRGLCQSIDDHGRLLLATETGIHPLSSGSVAILSQES